MFKPWQNIKNCLVNDIIATVISIVQDTTDITDYIEKKIFYRLVWTIFIERVSVKFQMMQSICLLRPVDSTILFFHAGSFVITIRCENQIN